MFSGVNIICISCLSKIYTFVWDVPEGSLIIIENINPLYLLKFKTYCLTILILYSRSGELAKFYLRNFRCLYLTEVMFWLICEGDGVLKNISPQAKCEVNRSETYMPGT